MIITMATMLVSLAVVQQVHPDMPTANPPAVTTTVTLPVAPPKPERPAPRTHPVTGEPMKTGLGPADYTYAMPAGVTTKEVAYYSDGVACYAK